MSSFFFPSTRPHLLVSDKIQIQNQKPQTNHHLQGYWLAIYEAISLSEHFLFKRGFSGYDPAIYTSPSLLPPGIAAILAFCFGVFGAVMGMAQVWFKGPIGRKIGLPGYGGDIGFPLAFAFAGISYIGFRFLERRRFGR